MMLTELGRSNSRSVITATIVVRLLLSLFFVALALSCDSNDRGAPPAENNRQTHTGTVPVRILPEMPKSSDDLVASFSEKGGFTISWEKNGVSLNNGNNPKLSRENFRKKDRITVTACKGEQKGSATVIIANSPPKVASVSFSPSDIHGGIDIAAVPVASDPDGDDVRFESKWSVNGAEVPDGGLVLKVSSFKRGDKISVLVTPYDMEGAGPRYKTREIQVSNARPYIVSTPPVDFSTTVYEYNVSAKDPDGDALVYTLATAPEGMVIDAGSGRITWRIDTGVSGSHIVEVVVKDTQGAEDRQRYSLTLK
jgi:hypothetical protein